MGLAESRVAERDPAAPPTARLVSLFAFAFGWMFLVRNSTGLLAPQLLPALGLGSRHLGILAATLAVSWSLFGWWIPSRFTRIGLRARLAAVCAILAAACLVGAASTNLAVLVVFQLLAGLAGGPALPLIQAGVATWLDSGRRGRYMGLVQGLGGSLLAAVLGPICLVPLVASTGWRGALLILALGAAAAALLATLALPRAARGSAWLDASKPRDPHSAPSGTPGARRNVLLCSAVGGLLVAWLVLGTTFFPLYLVSARGLGAVEMSRVMGLIGAGSLFGVLTIPHLSDRVGRRPALAIGAVLGCLSPLALLTPGLSTEWMRLLVFAGSAAGGTFPLFLAVIPSEAGPAERIATRVGIVQAASELAGGVLAPILAGWLADAHGLRVAVVLASLAPLLAGLLALGVNEPARLESSSQA